MHPQWTRHLKDPKDKQEFEQLLRGNTTIFNRILGIIKEEEDTIERWIDNPATFDSPNWEYKFAYKNGDRARLTKLKNLILSIMETKK